MHRKAYYAALVAQQDALKALTEEIRRGRADEGSSDELRSLRLRFDDLERKAATNGPRSPADTTKLKEELLSAIKSEISSLKSQLEICILAQGGSARK